MPAPVRKVLLAGIVLLGVLALLIVYVGSDPWGTTTVPNEAPTAAPKGTGDRDRAPFLQALDNLARARGLRYQDTATGTAERREVSVSSSGMLTGTVGHRAKGAAPQDVLRIGDRTYTRRQSPRGEGNPDGAKTTDGAKAMDGARNPNERSRAAQWTVDAPGETATVRQLDRFQAPAALAAQLRRALDATHALPDPKGTGHTSESVDGVPALRVDTPAGRLLVSKGKPYRVLRLEPYAPTAHSAPPRKRGASSPPTPLQVTVGPLKGGDSAGMTLTPLSDDQVSTVYDTLEREAGRLDDAVDGGVALSLDDAGDLGCGPGGCSVTERFTGRLDSAARARSADGTVTAVLRATVIVNGRNAGSCTSDRESFPLNGDSVSGSLSCPVTDAGPDSAGADAGTGNSLSGSDTWGYGHRRAPRLSARIHADVEAVALSEDEVGRLVEEVQRERGGAGGSAS
ncbi:hypothetical protein ACFVFQ_18940 [Streptomyces sp. NPDC057743]|uniref:hypothetical protein n=1 Tax=Streptomyces sp. NPDC057743 TaxID=3346236 RepID=UPI0036CE0207